jgi:hypothetical protein
MLNVLIASPGDASAGRDAVERALHAWNDHRSDATNIILRPRRWETGSIPILGRGDTQSVINSQLVDESDIVVAVFYHRLGSPTARAVSGTAEEIKRSVAAGKFVHLYFAKKKLPYDLDLEQFKALREFRKEMQGIGLVATFKSESELHPAITNAMEYDISHLSEPVKSDGELLREEIERSRSDPNYEEPSLEEAVRAYTGQNADDDEAVEHPLRVHAFARTLPHIAGPPKEQWLEVANLSPESIEVEKIVVSVAPFAFGDLMVSPPPRYTDISIEPKQVVRIYQADKVQRWHEYLHIEITWMGIDLQMHQDRFQVQVDHIH